MVNRKQITSDTIKDIDASPHGYIFHYYRAEVYRETNWRYRLNISTNCAIAVTAAILLYSFFNSNSPRIIILFNYLAILFFLYVESRRYRYYNILRNRVRLLEQYLFAEILDGKKPIGGVGWRSKVADSLRIPKIDMSRLESIAWRVRRNYIFQIGAIILAWFSKLANTPSIPVSIVDFINHAEIAIIPGLVVFMTVTLSAVWFVYIAYAIAKWSPTDDLT